MSLLTTQAVPPDRQYDHWREAVRSTHTTWDMPGRVHGRFHGTVQARPLGVAEVLACACDPCEGRRSTPELAASDDERVGVLFLLEGDEHLAHRDRRLRLRSGQFTLWSSARSLDFHVVAPLRKLTLLLPAEVASVVPAQHLDRAFDATRGCAALVLAQLTALSTLDALEPASQRTALASVVDLLAAAIGAQLQHATSAERRLVERAEVHIRSHLADPELDVDALAHALGVSRRTLDRSFAAVGRSAHRTIWAERLERCRAELLLHPSDGLSQIAFRWGFSDAAHFSRSFRSAFGEAPSRYRAARIGGA